MNDARVTPSASTSTVIGAASIWYRLCSARCAVYSTSVTLTCADSSGCALSSSPAHESQFFEWLPYNAGVLSEIPSDGEGRRAHVADRVKRRAEALRDRYQAPPGVRYVEAFQISEYGRHPDEAELESLFPPGQGVGCRV